MICKQCGTENNETAVFCRACGAKLEVPAPPAKVFCTGCGTENQADALFCRNCGNKLQKDAYAKQVRVEAEFRAAPQPQSSFGYQQGQGAGSSQGGSTGGTSFGSGFGAARESLGPKLAELFKMTFKSPVKYMQKAVKYDDYWLTTVFVALIADLIFAAIPAIALVSAISGYGASGYGSNVVGLFFVMFIAMVLIEGLCILALFAAEKIFGCSCSLKSVIAAAGPVYLLASLAMVVILLFAMTRSAGMMVIANIIAIPLMIMSTVLMIKAHEIVSGLKDAKMVYAFVVYVVIAMVFIGILLAIAGTGLQSGLENNFGYFLNNLLNNNGGY